MTMKNTKILAVSSVASALSVTVMAIGSLLDVLDVSLAVLAGLIVAVIAAEFGDRWGWGVYAASGLLSLLLPHKVPGIVFLLFCGWYPILQKKIQMLRPIWSWVVKEAVFNLILCGYLFVGVRFLHLEEANWISVVTFLFANILFVLYDVLLDRFILFYIVKLRDRIGFHKWK